MVNFNPVLVLIAERDRDLGTSLCAIIRASWLGCRVYPILIKPLNREAHDEFSQTNSCASIRGWILDVSLSISFIIFSSARTIIDLCDPSMTYTHNIHSSPSRSLSCLCLQFFFLSLCLSPFAITQATVTLELDFDHFGLKLPCALDLWAQVPRMSANQMKLTIFSFIHVLDHVL